MNVLFATDGSPDSIQAGAFLSRLRWSEADRIVIATVIQRQVMLSGRLDTDSASEVWQSSLLDSEARAAKLIVESAAKLMETIGAKVESRVYSGYTPIEILHAAGEIEADLIVVGRHGKSQLQGWLMGSVSQGVLERADCSVLVGRSRDRDLSKIVIGYDGSPQSDVALEWVKKLPLPHGVTVRVVSVVEPLPAPAAGPEVLLPVEYATIADTLERQRISITESIAARAVSRLREWGYEPVMQVENGRPSAVLCEVVDQWGADLVLLGAHAQGSWLENLLGNTARGVSRRANCSTLIARPGKAEMLEWVQKARADEGESTALDQSS